MAKTFKKEVRFFIFFIFLSFLLLFVDQRGWLGSIRGTVEKPFLFFEEELYQAKNSVVGFFDFFNYWQEGEKELMRLQGQVKQLALDQAELASCWEENEEMRALLGAPLSPSWQFVPAKVVGVVEKMRLDKGRRDGFQEGMMIVSENILVGKVVSLTETSALVQLPTDPNSKIPVVIKKVGSAGVQARGILISQRGELIISQILQSEDVRPGDLVLTAGEDWLPDLLIGQISEVVGQEAAIHKEAKISPLIDYQRLRIVFGVLP